MSELNLRYQRAKRALFEKAYDDLNEKQREAVFTVNNPLLILAGAGSGKTTVLVRRVAFLIRYGNAYYGENTRVALSESYVNALEQAASLSKEDIRAVEEETPLMRAGEPMEVASCALFLAGDGASFITGEVLNVSGGYVI